MISFTDRLLDIYFRKILEAVAMLPSACSYSILRHTGHIFRNFHNYACAYHPGVLVRAYHTLKEIKILPPECNVIEFLQELLRFESRFVMENIWVRKQDKRHIIESFHKKDISALEDIIGTRNYVIVSAHFPGIIDLVGLLRTLGYKATFVASNAMNQPWGIATPMQRSLTVLFRSWMHHQPLIFSDEKNIIDKCCNILVSQESVVMAADVPGYQGAKVSMFGKTLWVPAGSAIMAWKCKVPILVAIPWASACDKPYNIFLRTIPASQDSDAVMTKIFEYIETVVRLNPACWNGWLYFHKMLATYAAKDD
jgi:lauroyl/myristoyl acyltransferase